MVDHTEAFIIVLRALHNQENIYDPTFRAVHNISKQEFEDCISTLYYAGVAWRIMDRKAKISLLSQMIGKDIKTMKVGR